MIEVTQITINPHIPIEMPLVLDLLLSSELPAPLMVHTFTGYGSWKTHMKQGSAQLFPTDFNFSCF